MGVPVCLIYICTQSVFRLVFGKDRAIFPADITFSVTAALVSFFFMVFYNNGQVRLHLILGEALGFFVFMHTAGKHLALLCNYTADMLHKGAVKLLYPFWRVGRAFVNIFLLLWQKIHTFFTKKESLKADENKNDKKFTFFRKKFNLITKIHLKIKNKSV